MIAIVDYQGGNLASVLRALEHLGHKAVITDDLSVIRNADRVIVPGVGTAQATMRAMKERGLDTLLREEVFAAGIPLLGICIGVQIIFEHSAEDDTPCLGLIEGDVERFSGQSDSGKLKVPQIGWNQVHFTKPHPIFADVKDGMSYYFVNSFHPMPASDDVVFGKTTYGIEFASAVGVRNLVATQFHLEKSGRHGLKMLNNFCQWDGTLPQA
jgi:imidazole glycerol-phosphate synthase subunit HisH